MKQAVKELHRKKILETHAESFPILEVLPPIFPYSKRPTCSHSLTKPLQNGVYTCTSRAAYKVDGQIVCERHAGRELLRAHLRRMGFDVRQGDKLG